MAAPDQTLGITLTGGSGFFAQLLSLELPEISREAIETTTFDTTTARTYEPGSLFEPGSISGTMKFDPATKMPIASAAETFTVTFKNADTWAANGFLTTFGVTAGGMEEHVEASFSIKLSGDITVTDTP